MEILICILIVATLVIVGALLFRRAAVKAPKALNKGQQREKYQSPEANDSTGELQIRFEMLPATRQINETKLVEIKDNKILARVNNFVPASLQAALMAGNAIQGNSQVLYQAVIPAGAKLAKSRETAGAFRGIFHGADGIEGHADLFKVDNTASIASNAGVAAMGLASMIVGQYYMTQINTQLAALTGAVSRIADFQNNKYRSSVFALVAQIKDILKFQTEILENNELRTANIAKLNDLEHKCMELLGQANLAIIVYSKDGKLSFVEYEKTLPEIQNWYIYQKTLLEVLSCISDLKYTLHLGFVSREQCGTLLSTYSEQVKETTEQLNSWHQVYMEKLEIDTEANVRKRVGVDGLVHKLPGLVNKDYNFRQMADGTADMIAVQASAYEIPSQKQKVELFQKDVRVIAKEGKFYFLPDSDGVEA